MICTDTLQSLMPKLWPCSPAEQQRSASGAHFGDLTLTATHRPNFILILRRKLTSEMQRDLLQRALPLCLPLAQHRHKPLGQLTAEQQVNAGVHAAVQTGQQHQDGKGRIWKDMTDVKGHRFTAKRFLPHIIIIGEPMHNHVWTALCVITEYFAPH